MTVDDCVEEFRRRTVQELSRDERSCIAMQVAELVMEDPEREIGTTTLIRALKEHYLLEGRTAHDVFNYVKGTEELARFNKRMYY